MDGTVRIARRRWTQRLWLSFGLQDRQAKPLLQCVGVDALVIALLGDGRVKSTMRSAGKVTRTSSSLDRIGLTTVTASV